MDWNSLLTFAVIGLMFFMMMRHGGGCCGGMTRPRRDQDQPPENPAEPGRKDR
jgi:hypothetical protein